MTLSREQHEQLDAALTRDQIETRQVGKGRQAAYLAGYEAIRQANTIFGHGGWGMTVDDLQYHAMSSGGFYRATVTVTVAGCEPQQDVGGCVAQNDTADQHDMAFKGAVTDAMKRALRHYGAAFGNDLYRDDVPAPAPAQSQQTTRQQAQRTATVHEPRTGAIDPTTPAVKTETPAQRGELMALVQEGLGKDPDLRATVAAQWGCKPEQVNIRLGTKSDAELAAIIGDLTYRATERQTTARIPIVAVPAGHDVEELRRQVAASLEHDREAADKLPKPATEMNEAELAKTLAWLNRRARALSS